MKMRLLVNVIACASCLGLVSPSNAVPVIWTLADATLEEVVTGDLTFVSGSFTHDPVSNQWFDIGFSSLGPDETRVYGEIFPTPPADTTLLSFTGSGPSFGLDHLEMVLDNPLPETGGIVNAIIIETTLGPPETESLCIEGCFLTGEIVPAPAAVWLFGSGLLGIIGTARRKKGA